MLGKVTFSEVNTQAENRIPAAIICCSFWLSQARISAQKHRRHHAGDALTVLKSTVCKVLVNGMACCFVCSHTPQALLLGFVMPKTGEKMSVTRVEL